MTQTQLQPGIYFDNTRGWHISALVVDLALRGGWTPDFEDAPEYAAAITCLKAAGSGPFEAFVTALEDGSEVLSDLEFQATDYIASYLIPEDCWCGYSEGFGDWGVWGDEDD